MLSAANYGTLETFLSQGQSLKKADFENLSSCDTFEDCTYLLYADVHLCAMIR